MDSVETCSYPNCRFKIQGPAKVAKRWVARHEVSVHADEPIPYVLTAKGLQLVSLSRRPL